MSAQWPVPGVPPGRAQGAKRGFVITLDALAALAFLLIAVLYVSQYSFRPVAPGGTYLKQVSQDLLVVLEKGGGFDRLVLGNSTMARKTLLASPESVCMSLLVLTPDGRTITMISKPDCGVFRYEFQRSSITFDNGNQTYLATVESWFKRVET